jgi:hypothetical protein
MAPAPQAGVVISVETDRVCLHGDHLIIEAVEPMDWPVREFCRVPIFFEARKFHVRRVTDGIAPFARRYELWPWPADLHDQSTQSVSYDATYVKARDEAARARRGRDRWHLVLLPFFPFLGLCWSGFKQRVLTKAGFEPRSITSASIALMFNLLLVEGIFVGWLGSGMLMWFLRNTNLRTVDLALTALLAADVVLRYSQHLKLDVDQPWGFCEWLWPRKRKK